MISRPSRQVTPVLCGAFIISSLMSGCNDRAQMGGATQRTGSSDQVIPGTFANTMSKSDYQAFALNLKGSALTLNSVLETSLDAQRAPGQAIVELPEDTFMASWPSIATITGGNIGTNAIETLANRGLWLDEGDTDCQNLPSDSGLTSLDVLAGLRSLANELSMSSHEFRDCLDLVEEMPGRQAATAYTFGIGHQQGQWLSDPSVKAFDGAISGGTNANESALSAWIYASQERTRDNQTILSDTVNNVSTYSHKTNSQNITTIEKREEYFDKNPSSGDGRIYSRLTKITFDHITQTISEESTYKIIDRMGGKDQEVSSYKVNGILKNAADGVGLDLSIPDQSSTIQMQLNDVQQISCNVSR